MPTTITSRGSISCAGSPAGSSSTAPSTRSTASVCGRRGPGRSTSAKLESVRAVSTWFEPDEGLALMAFRPRKAKSHDGDVVTAAVLGPESSPPVEDPRLTTTYDAGGWPVRAGLELWLAGEGEEEQFPRRAVRGGSGRARRSPRPASSTSEPSRSAGTAVGAMAPGSTSWPAGDEPGAGDHQRFRRRPHDAAARFVRRADAGVRDLARVGRQGDGDDRRAAGIQSAVRARDRAHHRGGVHGRALGRAVRRARQRGRARRVRRALLPASPAERAR